MSLVEVLPVEPVTPATRAPSSRRQPRASSWSARSGSGATIAVAVAHDDWPVELSAASTAARAVLPAPRARPRRPPRAPGRRSARRPRSRPRRPTNRSPGPTSRESITARSGSGALGVARGQLSLGQGGEPACRQVDHARTPGRARSASRATRHVVEGLLAAVLELLALLVALPGDHHHVARLGLLDHLRDRAAAVHLALGVRPGALHHLVDDRLRLLAARVVRGHEHAIGQPPRGIAHQRALAAVAVAARAEDHVQPTARDLARRAQHVLERVGRVGVVHEHAEVLALVHRLEAARHPAEPLQRDLLHPQRAHRRHGSEHVLHVEEPGQRRLDPQLPVRRLEQEARAHQVELDVARAVVRLVLDPEGHGVHLGGDAAAVVVVHVHHRQPRLLEQPALGREVGVHRLVEVEVVLGEVREHAAREADARHAAELEGVRGDLHRRGAVAAVAHAPEGLLEVDRLGRRSLDVLLHARPPRA